MNVLKILLQKKTLLKDYIVKNVATVFMFDLLSKLLTIFITVIVIRSLSKVDYAYFTYYQAVATLFTGIIANGLVASYIRYETENISRFGTNYKNLYNLNIKLITFLYLCIFVIVILLNKLFLRFLATPSFFLYFILGLVLAFAMSIFRLNIGYYQARDQFKYAGKLLNINMLILIILIIPVLVIGKLNANNLALIYISSFFIITVIGYIKINRFKSLDNSNNFNFIKEYYQSSSWLIFYYILIGLFSKLDIFMITKFLGPDDLANYGVANQYFLLSLSLLPSIKAVLMVRTSKIDMVDSVSKQKAFTLSWIYKSSPFIIITSVLVYFLSDIILPIINGQDYNDAIVIFKIFLVGTAFSYIFAPNVDILRSMKKYKELAYLGFIALILNFCLNLYFIPLYGITAAAVTTVISQIVINLSSTLLVIIYTKEIRFGGE